MSALTLRAGAGRWIKRLALVALAAVSGGCPFIIPTPGSQVNAPATEVLQAIKPQVTTRTDVLMMLADPNFRLEDDRYFVYDWRDTHAVVGVALPGGGVAAAGLGDVHAVAIEFAADGRVVRLKDFAKPDDKKGEPDLWGDIRAWIKSSDVTKR